MMDLIYCCTSSYRIILSLSLSIDNKMNLSTECIVEGFIREALLPEIWKGIELRIMEKKIERHLSRVVSKDMVIDLLDSTTKNSQIISKKSIKEDMKNISEVKKPEEKIRVMTKRSKHI